MNESITVKGSAPIQVITVFGGPPVPNLIEGITGMQFVGVRVGTTGSSYVLSGGTPNVLDGIPLQVKDLILVKDQSTQSQNGIYAVQTVGAGTNGSWIRAERFSVSENYATTIQSFVSLGTINGGNYWVLITDPDNPPVLNTTALVFVEAVTSGVEAGNGLAEHGSVISVLAADSSISVASDGIAVSSTYAGNTSLETVGTVSTGVWQGTAIDVAHGGTGAATSDGGTLFGNFSGTNGNPGFHAAGSADQVLGVAHTGGGLEYKTIEAGANVTITPSAGAITIAASGSGGGITGAGNLSPLFSTSVVSETLDFSLTDSAAGTLFGNFGGTSGAPSFNAAGTPDQLLGAAHTGSGIEYKTLIAGSNVTITPSAGAITIAASGSGGGGAITPSARLGAPLGIAAFNTATVLANTPSEFNGQIAIGLNDALWLGTASGTIYKMANGDFTTYSPATVPAAMVFGPADKVFWVNNGNLGAISDSGVSSYTEPDQGPGVLCAGFDGNIWCAGYYEPVLYVYSSSLVLLHTYTLPISGVGVDRKNICATSQGIWLYQNSAFVFISYGGVISQYPFAGSTGIYGMATGVDAFGTEVVYAAAAIPGFTGLLQISANGTVAEIPTNTDECAYPVLGPDTNIYFISDYVGKYLYALNVKTGAITQVYQELLGTVVQIAFDNAGNLWCGVLNGGSYVLVCLSNPNTSVVGGYNLVATVAGSTSGNLYYSMPEQGVAYKKVVLVLNAFDDAGSTITFATPFLYTPAVTVNNTGVTPSSVSTTSLVLPTAATASGVIVLEGM